MSPAHARWGMCPKTLAAPMTDVFRANRIGGMKTNESNADRIIRFVIAIIAAVVAWKTAGAISVIAWIVAAIMALTAIVGFCPLYRVFGISTCKVRQ